ncbi:TetR family transcriptional regulator [Micromonospora sp. DR5-3]|uniref:acyl-CoA-like ligand-binding transcription factor n=1 Tax=unclassified Micromonospora TaxID=2617518 RepID=UPI0011D8F0FC|nr:MULTISPECIES: TetR family transcriptional regulator [unclassified Micromonospora]MCW3819019.1 TetR family transcriptional regulator [Micromonospora sp. DR5-3]TYC19750.1 TetR family transcriptional regulator [Micromonospora sp. MP36]
MTDGSTSPATAGLRDRKKRQTRAALATAALRLVVERGLEHVTVEEISEAADVSSRTFFNYFPSKDDALIGDHAVDTARLVARVAEVPPEVSALAAIRTALAEVIDEMQADRELWLLRMEVVTRNPALLPRLAALGVEAERTMTETLAARVGVPPDHGFPALLTAVTGAAFRTAMLRWAAAGGARSLAELADEAFDALAAGLPDPRCTR